MDNYINNRVGCTRQQLSLPLTTPLEEASLYLNNSGYFSVLVRTADRKMRQHSYPLEQLPCVLRNLDPNVDTWISQAVFWSSKRAVVNVKSLGLVFLDIDYYSTPWGEGRTPMQAASDFVALCDDNDIPRPSLVVHSGRGLQAKWILEKAIPRQTLPRWNKVEEVLCSTFKEYGADPKAKDAARVLRAVQTINTKSHTYCQVVWPSPGTPIELYGFEYLSEFILPLRRDEIKRVPPGKAETESAKGTRKAAGTGLTLATLNWNRVEDLRSLIRLRGGIEEGMRMSMLFYMLNFLALSHQVTPGSFYREAAILAQEIDPEWDYRSKELSTVYAKMKDYLAGKEVEFNGRKYPALYTPTNETLIAAFRITDEEQKEMITIVDAVEHRRRQVVRLRRAGVLPRCEYESKRAEQTQNKREKALELASQNLSAKEIAGQLGVSVRQVWRYLKGCDMVRSLTNGVA